ncbi:MAG: RluA family pseudouridine synthase [Turneriella sp.]|nr:RluA family pseudouridine synthase [Turneriella sp.]
MNKPKQAAGAIGLTLPPGIRLDKFLSAALAERGEDISRSRLQKLIEEGGVAGIDPAKIKASYTAKQETAIRVTLPAEKDIRLKPLEIKIPVLFEDKYLAVVHKPAGMTVHPGAGTGDDTLVHALLTNVETLSPHDERPGIVHRLDRETEGLMVVAKTEKARAALSQAFAERLIQKTYVALVWGKVTLPEEVSGYIWRDVHNRKKMRFGEAVPERVKRARDAELIVSDQKQLKYATRLEIELITGRTHQIRATAAFFNAPIIGDAVYGNDEARAKLYKIGREKKEAVIGCGMLLVAQKLSFQHPFTKKKLSFSLPVPERFAKAQENLI